MIKFLWKYRGFYLYTVFKIRCTEKRDIKLFIDIALIVMRFKQALSFPCSGATSPSSVGGPWAMMGHGSCGPRARLRRGCVQSLLPCPTPWPFPSLLQTCRYIPDYLSERAMQCNATICKSSHRSSLACGVASSIVISCIHLHNGLLDMHIYDWQ